MVQKEGKSPWSKSLNPSKIKALAMLLDKYNFSMVTTCSGSFFVQLSFVSVCREVLQTIFSFFCAKALASCTSSPNTLLTFILNYLYYDLWELLGIPHTLCQVGVLLINKSSFNYLSKTKCKVWVFEIVTISQ